MFQLFVVFHKKIFDECYADIPQEILTKYFTFVAVNKNIPKEYTPNKYKIINEWELPIYDDTFQQRGYNENSVLYHVYANNLHKQYKYIGFFQYDMFFNNSTITTILDNLNDQPKYFAIFLKDFVFCSYLSWYQPNILEFIIDDYEQYYKKKFNRLRLYPLLNTYIIPIETYNNTMPWIIALYDKLYNIYTALRIEFKPGGIYERIMAYAIGNSMLPCIVLNDINHDHKLKEQVY